MKDGNQMRKMVVAVLSMAALLTSSMAAAVDVTDDEYVTFYHHDVLGSPIQTSDHLGRVLWYENSAPYGKSLSRRSSGATGTGDALYEEVASRQGYTGHTQDTATSLVYMKARHYDPAIGRFYSNDPVGFRVENPMMFNRYAFANNNPYKFVDPDGRQSVTFDSLSDYTSLAKRKRPIPAVELSPNLSDALIGVGILGVIWAASVSEDGSDAQDDTIDEKSEVSEEKKRSRTPSAETKRQADAAATDADGTLRCQYCGQELTTEYGHPNSREYDHIDSYANGGSSDIENINDACRTCNRSKGSKTLEEWREWQQEQISQ